MKEEEKNYIM